jgi:hypothetical protein
MCFFPGRSSDFPNFSAAFPSLMRQWHHAEKLNRLLFNKRGGVTAAGPFPILTGFPIKLKLKRLKFFYFN